MEESGENNIIKELENIDYMDNVVKTEIITDKILSEVDHVLQLADGDLNSVSISDSDNIFEKIQLDITFGNTNKKRDIIMEPNLIENNNMGNFYPENNCVENNCLENIPEKINLKGSDFKENCSENNSILNENSNSIKNIRFNENLNRLTTTNKIVVSVGDEGCLVETNSELINKQLLLTDDSKPKFTSTPLIPHKDREKFFYKDKENSFQKGNFVISGSENLLNKNSVTITPIKRINDTTDSGISSKNTFERSVLKRRSEDGGCVIESKRMALKENVGRFYDQFFKPKKIFKDQSDSGANSGGVLSDSVNTNSDCSRISGSKNIFINPKKIVEHQNKFILKEDLKNNNNEYNSKNLEDIPRINASKNVLDKSERIFEDRFTNLKQIDYRPDQIENQLKNKNATVENKNPKDNTQVNNESNCDETIYLNETEFYNLQMIIENDLKNSTQQKNDIKITLNDRFKELTKISPRIIKHTPKGIEITVFKDSKIEQSNLIRDEHLNNKELLKNFKRCVTLTNNNNIFISLLISPNEIDRKSSVVKSLNEKFKLMPGNQNEMKIFDDNILKNKNSNILLCRNFQVIVNNNCKEESLNYTPVEDFKKNSNDFTSRIISYSENNSEKIIQPFLNFDESSEKILLEENSPNKTFGEYSSDKIITTENSSNKNCVSNEIKNCISNEIQNFDSDEKRNENKKQILETKGSDKLKDISSDEIYISPEFDTKKMSCFRNVDNHFSSETSSITSEIDDYISLIENRRFHSVTNKNVLSKNENDDDLTSNTTPVDIEEINNININKSSPGFDKTVIPSRDVDKMVNPLGDTSSEISCISDSINLKDYENSLDEFIKDESDSDVEIIPNEIEIISVSDSDMDTEKRVFNYEEYADVTFVDDDDDVNVIPANNKSKKNNLVKIEKGIIDLTLNKNDIIDLTFNEIDVKMDVIDLTLNPNKNNVIDLTIDGDSEFESIIKDLEDVVKSTDDDFVIENDFIKETIVLKEDISSIKDVTTYENQIPIVIDKERNGEESDNAPNDRFVINVSIDSQRTFINQSSIHSHEDLIGDEERYEKEIAIIPEENECRVIQNLKVGRQEHPLVAGHRSVSSSENQATSTNEDNDLQNAQNLASKNIEMNNKILGNKTKNLFVCGVVSKFEDITENSSVNDSMEFKNNKSGMENKILLDESFKNVNKIISEELESNEAVIENNIRDQKNSQQSEKEQGISLKNVNNALINTQEDFDEDDGDINKTLIPEERNGNKNSIVDLDKTITPTNIDVKNSFPTDSEKTVIDNSNDYQINFEFKKSDDNSYSKIEKPIYDTNFNGNKIDFEFKKVDIQDSTSKTVLEKPVFDDKNPESRNINFEFKIDTKDIPSTSKTVLDDKNLNDCKIRFEFKKVDTNDVPSTSKTVLEKSVLKNTLSNDIPSTSKTVLEKCFSQSIIENKTRILKRRASAEDVERPEIKKQKLQNQCIAVGISKDDTFTDDIADQNFTRLLFNSQKTIDENDPNWIDIKDLATSNEFFTHVCIQWQSDTLPNPQKNLTKRFVDRQPKVVDQPKSCGCFSVIYYLNNRIKYHRQKIYNLEDTLRRCTFGKKKRRSFLDDIQKSMKIIENLEKHKEEVTQINKFYVDNNSGWDAMYLNSIQFNELQEQDATFQMMDRFYK